MCLLLYLLIFLTIPWITYREDWAILFMNFATVIDFITDFYIIGEWPFSYLIKCDRPYSTYWALNGYFLYTLIYWRLVVRNFIDIITFNILGLRVKRFFMFIFHIALPNHVYSRLAWFYWIYYTFLRQYRP